MTRSMPLKRQKSGNAVSARQIRFFVAASKRLAAIPYDLTAWTCVLIQDDCRLSH